MFSPYLERRLGKRRLPDEPIEKQHQDIAASLQKRLEEILFFLLNSLRTNHSKLCLSGGVAFNCVVNGKIFANTTFREVYIPPAPGDAGLAIGAAYYLWTHILNQPRTFVMKHAYWGPEFGEEEIGKALSAKSKELEEKGCVIEKAIDEHELCRRTAQHLAEGKVVGWFQGRMEFGPRALGNRSILVDPRRPEMKDILNARIKKREKFRPFAPSILLERVNEYFEIGYPDPFMIKAYPIKKDKRQIIPAVTHIDGTGRLQTVNKEENPLYWQLIREFEKITSVPVILNTSFNENEPIVCNPTETLNCFLRTKMDVLVLKNYLIHK
jgi:carbamoyltransferase